MENQLVTQTEIDKSRKLGEQRLSNLGTEDVKLLRLRAKNDLFFLCHGILGYKKLSPNLHGNLCSWMQKHDTDQFREILLPRGHYKSTVVTISDSIRIALPDDAGDAPWPRNLGTNCRILLGHETHDSAARFLFSIIGHFTHNPILMGLFPECVPNAKKHRVNKYELEIPRQEIWSEPTFDTMGVGGRSQGRHYNFLKFDDLFGDKARDSVAERQTTLDWFDNTQSFFSTFGADHLDLVGTRWAFDDIYIHAHEIYGSELKKYIRGVEERNAEGEVVTIFPEEFSSAKLRILKKNRMVFSAQYANDPAQGASEFDERWLKYFHWINPVVIGTFGQPRINLRNDGDIIFLIDPAVNGLASFVITLTDQKDNHYILKAKKAIWDPVELVEEIFSEVVKYQPRMVGIESVLFSALFEPWLKREMQIRNIRFKIEPMKPENKQKDNRIRGLVHYFQAGQVYVNENDADLLEEFRTFGASENTHILDAIAYGPRYWRTGVRRRADSANDAAVQIVRDAQTGYSQI